jgi:hypothetical protein
MVAPEPPMPTVASVRPAVRRATSGTVHPKGPHLDVHEGQRSVPVLHTMPVAIDRKHFWHVVLNDEHYDWFGRVLAIVVVACGALIFLLSPTLHRPVLTFLQPWSDGGTTVTAPQPAAPTTVPVSAVVLVSSKPDTAKASVIAGRLVETQARADARVTASGQQAVTEARSGGTVRIVNTSDAPFTFVARTRLLSKEGILFRMTAPATVPAKKTIEVSVLADVAGPTGDIAASQFTLPGLSSAEQREQIYGVSDSPMTGGSGTTSVVAAEDLEKAKAALQSQLTKEAEDDLRALVKPEERLLSGLVSGTPGEFVGPKVGTVGTSFKVSLAGVYSALLFPERPAIDALRARVMVARNLPSSATLELANVRFVVTAYDLKSGLAEIRVEADAPAP